MLLDAIIVSRRDALRSAPAVPDDSHGALRHPRASGRRSAGAAARRRSPSDVRADARAGARRAARTRARDPRRSDRSVERLGDAVSLRHDRDHRGAAAGRDARSATRPTGCELVFTHEYTHILHLDRTRGCDAGRAARVRPRAVRLSRTPFLPDLADRGDRDVRGEPDDRRGTRAGGRFPRDRRRGGARTAGSSRSIASAAGSIDWPGGNAPYAYGAYFHQFLADRYGAERLTQLADATAGRVPFFGDGAFKQVFGRSRRRSVARLPRRARAAPVASERDRCARPRG